MQKLKELVYVCSFGLRDGTGVAALWHSVVYGRISTRRERKGICSPEIQ